MHFYGSASAEPFFAACFPGERGSTTAHLRRLPREGRAGGAYKTLLKHRVQGAALPAMLPSSPSADYISVCTFTVLLRQSRFLLPLFRRTGEHDCASPAVAPQGASRRRLLIFAQASRAKTKGMGLRLFCKLFMNPIDKVGKQEYSFSSRTDRVLKQVKPVRQEVLETVKQLKNSRCFPFGSISTPGF